jgi:hypothetical protein
VSWCLGAIGLDAGSLDSDGSAATLSVRSGELALRAGGPGTTCRHGSFSPEQASPFEGWLVLGLGIDATGASATLLDDRAWSERLAPREPRLDRVDGHYLIVRWKAGSVELRTDPLGMRTAHITRTDGGILFSTRLDWIARACGGLPIDYSSFGAHWLAYNSFLSHALLEGVRRLGAGGIARCDRSRIEIEESPWAPREGRELENPIEILDSLLALRAPDGITLGLSGGLDSRVLLAVLLGGSHRFGLHLFGEPAQPDVAVAMRIAAGERLDILHLDEPVPRVDDLLPMLRDYVGSTAVVEPASAITKLRYYPRLAATGRIMIDGGMGEIARRQFGNRLLRRGRGAVMRRDAAGVAAELAQPRADIFEAGVDERMREGMIAEMREFLEGMPDPGEIGIENFIDLLAVRTRFPHVAGMEQGRVDGVLPNFMPYAQPSFIQSALQLPLVERRNGRLFRRIIAAEARSLTRYPLVKSQILYPYRFTTLPAWLWTHLRKMTGGVYHDQSITHFLELMREPALEMLHSEEVRSYGAYDMGKLGRIVEGYYAGDISQRAALDWWLAFETWRRGVS